MTMSEFKPTATAYFNLFFDPTSGYQDLFANEWDAWSDFECRYTADNNAYKSVIDKYIESLNIMLDYNKTMNVSAVATRTSTDTIKKTGTDSTTAKGTTTTDGGERGGNNYTYPTGYTEEPDTAYISTRATEDAYTDSVTDNSETTVTHNTTDTHEVSDVDNLARAAAIDPEKAAKAHAIIRECVFAFVANIYTGVL